MDILKNLQSYVEKLVEKNDFPAMTMAVWKHGKRYKGAAGLLNVNTGVEATTDSIFQIGSISKVFTTCLIMQLVDEKRLELDHPVKHYLRNFSVACPEATETITVRQLLCHTSGMAGDYFPEDVEGAKNLIERYVERCSLLPQVHAPGEMFSYSNSAFCTAGRLAEVTTGLSWESLIEERIIQPLGLTHTIANPQNSLRYRVAMGHVTAPGLPNNLALSSRCYFPMGMAPAGSAINMTPSDLIDFALAHLSDGLTADGDRWLSDASVKAMQTPQVHLAPHSPLFQTDMGLGWFLSNKTGEAMYGHDGVTVGQCALLRVIPEHQLIISLMINGADSLALQNILSELAFMLAGITLEPSKKTIVLDNPALYCGRYQSLAEEYKVFLKEGDLYATCRCKTLDVPEEVVRLTPIDQCAFSAFSKEGIRKFDFRFDCPDPNGYPKYLAVQMTLNQRVITEPTG